MPTTITLTGAALAMGLTALRAQAPTPAAPGSAIAVLQEEAKAVRPIFKSELVGAFLDATRSLPPVEPRTVFRNEVGAYLTEKEADSLPEEQRKGLRKLTVDERLYYTTRYGSSLAYSRPLEILAESGFKTVAGKRILDFGYGAIGHLRLLASLGADVVGVDVDPLLKTLYATERGKVPGLKGKVGGLATVHGRWPAESEVVKAIGERYDLFLTKNTLKNGYIHPEKPVDKRMTIDLGVPDEVFVKNLARILEPGGYVMIYNLCPAQNPADRPYIPWADGRCPFPRATWESGGFTVLRFDEVDDMAAREMALALGWDKGPQPMDLEKNLFAWYTLARKR